jgi:E3 ubiquitin-protein ligase MYCBP2
MPCGHACAGVAEEAECLGCLECGEEEVGADDYCSACYTESLGEAPCLRLACGHVFHAQCMQRMVRCGYDGPAIRFGCLQCPLCRAIVQHPALEADVAPMRRLYEDVKAKSLERLKHEGLEDAPEVKQKGGAWEGDLAGFAMQRYNYYKCHKCEQAYFGGARHCDAAVGGGDGGFDASTLVCPACLPPSAGVTDCPEHGKDYIEYKCRFCCSVAVFFCFGTTHFCKSCHDRPGFMRRQDPAALPACPAGPQLKQLSGPCPLGVPHPEAGEEFALGCGLCKYGKHY